MFTPSLAPPRQGGIEFQISTRTVGYAFSIRYQNSFTSIDENCYDRVFEPYVV
jgi:hypothetical protein